jgi:hypothetical protein
MGLVNVGKFVDICGGIIHSSERQCFCCKSIGTCSKKGHKTKLKIEPNTLYIQHTHAGQGRFEPSLSVSLIPDDITVSELIAKDHSLEVWTAVYFDALKAGRAIFLDVREFFLHQREDAMPIPNSQLKYTAPFLYLAQVPAGIMGVLLEQFGERSY